MTTRHWLMLGAATLGIALAVFLIRRTTSTAPFSGRVASVSEGDTLTVLRGRQQVHVRLEGVDAPELRQAFGQQAKEFASARALGRDVEVRPRDRESGWTIARVIVDGRDLGQEIMASGFGWHFARFGVDPAYATAENDARAKRLGLWQDASPMTPWEYRKAHPREN
jgi:micrococcal nuclease